MIEGRKVLLSPDIYKTSFPNLFNADSYQTQVSSFSGVERRQKAKLWMGDRGTRRSSLQSAKTGFQIFQPKRTAEWVTNFVMHLNTIFRDCRFVFSGGSTLHCLDQIFDQEEHLHLEQRLLHQFPLALVIPPAAAPPRLPRGLRLLLHQLRPHAHPWGETVQAARYPICQPPRQLEEGWGGNPGQKWK